MLKIDYYHVGLLSAISDNHQDHAEDESDGQQLDWSVALTLRPMTLQQFLGDHFKYYREKQEHKKRDINHLEYATTIFEKASCLRYQEVVNIVVPLSWYAQNSQTHCITSRPQA